jgi:hypothetical protein
VLASGWGGPTEEKGGVFSPPPEKNHQPLKGITGGFSALALGQTVT